MSFLRELYWELSAANGRFEYIQFLFGQIPGLLGKKLRQILYKRFIPVCGRDVQIYPGVRIHNAAGLTIGDNVGIGFDCALQAGGGIEIHDRAAFGPGCKVWSLNHRFDDADSPMLDQGYEFKKVVIGKDVWLAANVFIMPGVELGEGCIVSAGSVVGARKYPAYSIISGNPARVIGNRKKQPQADDVNQQASSPTG